MIATAPRTFARRIGYITTCVIPATLLSPESTGTDDTSSLRADASRDGISFAQVMHALEEGIYLTRVAATPDQVRNGYTVLLSEQDLYYALPWDDRVERCSPASILALLRTHAAEVQPLTRRVELPEVPAIAALTPLDTVDVSTEEIQGALAQIAPQDTTETTATPRRANQFYLQQALLQVMIDRLMEQLYQAQEQTCAMALKARCALLAQLQRWHRSTQQERMVNAAPKFSMERQQVMWRLTVGLPALA